jgi:PqqD family protein of HPr-rel-A system
MKINKKIAISESGFVFDSHSGDSYSINPIAAEILELIKSGKSRDEIKNSLLEKYNVTVPVLEKSLDEFMDTLKKLNIISK